VIFADSTLREARIVRRSVGFSYIEEEVIDETNLNYDFISRHTNRGEYVVTYTVSADKSP